jgi:hypothetical protein
MLTKSHCSLIAIALVAAHDLRTQFEAKKNAKLFLEAAEAYEETQRQNEAQIQYLCHMLDQHGIAVTEFDLIALHFNM